MGCVFILNWHLGLKFELFDCVNRLIAAFISNMQIFHVFFFSQNWHMTSLIKYNVDCTFIFVLNTLYLYWKWEVQTNFKLYNVHFKGIVSVISLQSWKCPIYYGDLRSFFLIKYKSIFLILESKPKKTTISFTLLIR